MRPALVFDLTVFFPFPDIVRGVFASLRCNNASHGETHFDPYMILIIPVFFCKLIVFSVIQQNERFIVQMDSNMQSFDKLKKDVKTAKILSTFLPKDARKRFKEIEAQLSGLESTIDLFNEHFTDLGWCAYDSMSLPLMREAINAFESGGSNAGEEVLLKYYCNAVKDIMHVLKNKAAPFAQRYSLIQHAFDDHFAERYYASVPLFLIIIDGSVNDYTKSKGFFAEGTDLTAWDCLVGCSDGLTKIKTLYNKGRNKTNFEEIHIPFRNGILHGRDLNYGNQYVSCKCVALMFALADWMNMKDSEEKRKESLAYLFHALDMEK